MTEDIMMIDSLLDFPIDDDLCEVGLDWIKYELRRSHRQPEEEKKDEH